MRLLRILKINLNHQHKFILSGGIQAIYAKLRLHIVGMNIATEKYLKKNTQVKSFISKDCFLIMSLLINMYQVSSWLQKAFKSYFVAVWWSGAYCPTHWAALVICAQVYQQLAKPCWTLKTLSLVAPNWARTHDPGFTTDSLEKDFNPDRCSIAVFLWHTV